MGFPDDTAPGEQLTAEWLNSLKAEVRKNVLVGSKGITFNRSTGGTTLTSGKDVGAIAFSGVLVDIVNGTGYDFGQWWFAGIEEVTNRDNMEGNISRGVDYVLRKPTQDDLYGRLVMLIEPVPYHGAGQGYISSDSMITKIFFAEDESEDDFRFASIDTEASEGDENAYMLKAVVSGPIEIIDVEPKQDSHPTWRWAVIRFPVSSASEGDLYKVTVAESGGEVTIKRMNLGGTVEGDALVYPVPE